MSALDGREMDESESRQETGDDIIVVSGLPRSGTSMLMQMLAAGGIEAVTDERRKADEFNPYGYYEYEPVKQIEEDAGWLTRARGRALKIVVPLVDVLAQLELPCHVLMIKREIDEVLASQRKMAAGRGHRVSESEQDRLGTAMMSAYTHSRDLLAAQEHVSLLEFEYEQVLLEPAVQAHRIQRFLNRPMNKEAMIAAVDSTRIQARK